MEYAYKNRLLRNIKGERWEDIPGLDGYVLISNFGRIKRYEYEAVYRNGAKHIKPEMIIKPHIYKIVNKTVGDETLHLIVNFSLSKKKYCLSVPRLVYHCFVCRFDLDNNNLFVLTKDADNLNIRPENLWLGTRSDKEKRKVARKRFHSPLLDLSEERKKAIAEENGRREEKEISQYSTSGRKIKTFSSAVGAAKEIGISDSVIRKVAKGKGNTAGGYYWRFGHVPSIDVQAFRLAKQRNHRDRHGIQVSQYDMDGHRMFVYPSITDAAETTGIRQSAIFKMLAGTIRSAGGFFWKKGFGRKKINLSKYLWGGEAARAASMKRVKQMTLKGKTVRQFASITAAASYMGVGIASISGTCLGRQHTCKGYRWKFA